MEDSAVACLMDDEKTKLNLEFNFVHSAAFEKFRCPNCRRTLTQPMRTDCGHDVCAECARGLSGQLCPAREKNCSPIRQPTMLDEEVAKEMACQPVYCVYARYGCKKTMPAHQLREHLKTCAGSTATVEAAVEAIKSSSTREVACNLARAYIRLSSRLEAVTVRLKRTEQQIEELLLQPVGQPAGQERIEQLGLQLGQRIEQLSQLMEQRRLAAAAAAPAAAAALAAAAAAAPQMTLCLPQITKELSFYWKLCSISKLMENAATAHQGLCSPPVYLLSRNNLDVGYRCGLVVYLNGDVQVRGSHVSLYLVIHPGEYDGILKWPMNAAVTLSVLKQRQRGTDGTDGVASSNPYVYSFRSKSGTRNINSFQCPRQDLSNTPIGVTRFVPITTFRDPAQEYVVQDAAYFKCTLTLLEDR